MTARMLGLALALGVVASLPAAPAAQDAMVARDTVIDLGTLGGLASIAVAVNDRQQVVGFSQISPLGDIHSFLWEDGAMRDLTDTSGLRFDGAQDINDRGQIAGTAIDEANFTAAAAIWDVGRLTVLDVPSGAIGCSGAAINDHGDVAGTCLQGSENVGVVWTRKGDILIIGSAPGIGTYTPKAISNDALVVGYIQGAAGFAGGFAWKDGGVVRLDPFIVAEDVNDHGRIVGWGRPDVFIAALLLDRRGLTQLPGLSAPANNQAFAINRHGEIAGMSAGSGIVWVGGQPRVLPPLPGGFTALPNDINDRGDVAGYATTPGAGDPHAALWPRAAARRHDKTIE